MATRSTKPSPSAPNTAQTQLEPLSAADFKVYNNMAKTMDMYHNHFRGDWNMLYAACSPSSQQTTSTSHIMKLALRFVAQLGTHHDFEEEHIFPMLGQRMPAFKADALTGPLEQHRHIHAGLDRLEAYMQQCKSGERSLRREEVKEILDSFGTVLWTHLAEEVEHLGAENMRKYWSKTDMAIIAPCS